MLKKILENTDYSFEEMGTILESVGFTNVRLKIEAKEIVTNALTFKQSRINDLSPSVEMFYFGSRGELRHFYKGYQVSVKYYFYKKAKDKVPFQKKDHQELITESFQRFQLLLDESKIELIRCKETTSMDFQNCGKIIQIKFLVMDLKNEYVIEPLTYKSIIRD
jgi:hypothetical protein